MAKHIAILAEMLGKPHSKYGPDPNPSRDEDGEGDGGSGGDQSNPDKEEVKEKDPKASPQPNDKQGEGGDVSITLSVVHTYVVQALESQLALAKCELEEEKKEAQEAKIEISRLAAKLPQTTFCLAKLWIWEERTMGYERLYQEEARNKKIVNAPTHALKLAPREYLKTLLAKGQDVVRLEKDHDLATTMLWEECNKCYTQDKIELKCHIIAHKVESREYRTELKQVKTICEENESKVLRLQEQLALKEGDKYGMCML